jgi:hypothetical protein
MTVRASAASRRPHGTGAACMSAAPREQRSEAACERAKIAVRARTDPLRARWPSCTKPRFSDSQISANGSNLLEGGARDGHRGRGCSGPRRARMVSLLLAATLSSIRHRTFRRHPHSEGLEIDRRAPWSQRAAAVAFLRVRARRGRSLLALAEVSPRGSRASLLHTARVDDGETIGGQ